MAEVFENPRMYNEGSVNNGADGLEPSNIGNQMYNFFWWKKALVEAAKEQYFGQLADVKNMPKHFGKTIKMFHYLPLLDDRNQNDQGIDAIGASKIADTKAATPTVVKVAIALQLPTEDIPAHLLDTVDNLPEKVYFEGFAKTAADGVVDTAALTLAQTAAATKANAWLRDNGMLGAGNTVPADLTTMPADMQLSDVADPDPAKYTLFVLRNGDATDDRLVNYGNLYGSSKDVGTIMAKLPVLSETGGRVNRVGFKRIELEGSINKFGFFDEYTQESLDFDNDDQLEMHITQESVKAANEITEDQLQLDLLHAAGVVRYAGDATKTSDINGGDAAALAAGTVDLVSYDDLIKLGIELDNNRTPKNTKLITGSRMIDTRVVNSARYMYIGSELQPTLMKMKDYHGEAAFIPVAQYGDAGMIARGEIGAIGDFRFIVVPEMMHWEGAGAAANANEVCYTGPSPVDGSEAVNVYPMLVVGDGSFTTIGFQTDGKTVKFRITHKRPGKEIADRHDPYGEVGFYSIKWYYGFMALRPERIALIKTAAVM